MSREAEFLLQQEHLQNAINSGAPVLSELKSNRFTKRERQVLSYVFEGFTNTDNCRKNWSVNRLG
jgi:DNA-binding NarL/FixJ family response regulator